ncbi:hypothetical protein AHAS_Ahas17G0107900 [Arachis hypogaea]
MWVLGWDRVGVALPIEKRITPMGNRDIRPDASSIALQGESLDEELLRYRFTNEIWKGLVSPRTWFVLKIFNTCLFLVSTLGKCGVPGYQSLAKRGLHLEKTTGVVDCVAQTFSCATEWCGK